MTLTRRLIFLLAIVLPVALIAIFSYNRIRKDSLEQLYKERNARATLTARILRDKLDILTSIGKSISTQPSLHQNIEENKWKESRRFP